jgi:uncharacterized membrane protein YedE/YeeE
MEFHNFTPLTALAGGALIGLSAVFLLLSSGQTAGVSGLLQGALINESAKKRGPCALFLAGLVAGALLFRILTRMEASITLDAPVLVLVVGGILTGFGTSLGSGCTSGHGVCGMARGSIRSLAATITFMVAGVATVYTIRHVLGV